MDSILKDLYGAVLDCELDATVCAFNASTIDLCLSVYPWAPFRAHKAAINLHTLLDLRGQLGFGGAVFSYDLSMAGACLCRLNERSA